MKCILCSHKVDFFCTYKERTYFKCQNCHSIMLDFHDYLSAEKEKERYEAHHNDVMDEKYQKYATPIVNAVLKNHKKENLGLDFGSGTGPVITKLLKDQDYQMHVYDPFFADDKEKLEMTYDYIVCCEVMEHFFNPKFEFEKLRSMLNDEGTLYLKTSLYDESIDFDAWYYKNDQTHVFFYSDKALEYIKIHFGFTEMDVGKEFIVLTL